MDWNGWKAGGVCVCVVVMDKRKRKTELNGTMAEKGKLRHHSDIIVLWPRDVVVGWSHARYAKKQVHAKGFPMLPLPCSHLLPYKQRPFPPSSLFPFPRPVLSLSPSFSSLVFSCSIPLPTLNAQHIRQHNAVQQTPSSATTRVGCLCLVCAFQLDRFR